MMIDQLNTLLSLSVLIAVGLTASCGSDHPTDRAASAQAAATTSDQLDLPTLADDKPRDYAGLHNVVAFHEGCYSGSVPEGAAGFDTLAAMGVTTIISVDGAEPEVEAAKVRGMRYIHLPIGYNGFNEQRKLQLVRATRDALAEGPVYMHCHHGRHRSAGAAGTVIASLGLATPDQMVARMKVSGTSPSYKGLYACTVAAVALAPAVVDAVPADFPEVSRPAGFVKGMVEIDEINEHLKVIEKAGWAVPKDHPDLVPAAEAGRMADLFRVLAEGDLVKSKPADFAELMRENGSEAQTLEDLLVAGEQDAKKLSDQFQRIAASCKDCHVQHRD